MRKHPVRKFFGLTVLYAAIIIGIFVIQFKTESIISKNIGTMRVTLAQSQNDDESILLKNQFNVAFKGLNFFCNSDFPATVYSDEASKNLVLSSYEEIENSSIQFFFEGGTSLKFSVTSPEIDGDLLIVANISEGFNHIRIPFKTDKTLSVSSLATNKLLAATKTESFTLTASEAREDCIILSRTEHIASYLPYDPTKHFTFDSLENVAGIETQETDYRTNIKSLRNKVIPATKELLASANAESITEYQATAYVAEMAANGRWDEALSSIPDSFKKGSRRTYFSAPYFNNLANMNRSLVVETERLSSVTQSAIDSSNMDIYTADGIIDYILREKKTNKITKLLSIPSTFEEFSPTTKQMIGILSVYTGLYNTDEGLASYLGDYIDPCIKAMEEMCTLDGGEFEFEPLSELSLSQILTLGQSFIDLGNIKEKKEYTTFGYLLINRGIAQNGPIDLRTLSEIYPLIAKDNKYYPHTAILGYYGATPVWAWTCAPSIDYTIGADNIVNITIEVPIGQSHYVIFNGIPTFHAQIEIQKQMFRTDPRFETYNSSGYVYQSNTQTLLIKSRHKTASELIRLFCDPATNFTKN